MASAIREHDEILQETVASPSAEEGRERGEVRKQLAKATPEASLFRTEWETIPALVKESEDRLRGELRYSVNLVATIMLGFFAILIAVVLALLRK
jgi:hypothetical protein